MKQYLTMLISAAAFAGLVQNVTSDKWKKYVNAISGIMIVSVVLSPLPNFKNIDFFKDFEVEQLSADIQKDAVILKLSERIKEDVINKIYTEWGIEADVEIELSLNKNKEIRGVKEITIWTDKRKEEIRKLVQEIYSPEIIIFSS